MKDGTPSLRQLNRTFIGSVLFVDIVGYSKRTVPDQLEMKALFNSLLAEAVESISPAERIMVDTGDGAAIAFLGEPEDALFAALSLKDAVDEGKVRVGDPGFIRMGVNLGPLTMVRDINGHTNMVGDGVNDAQRVMSFAQSGEVMVSHSYYDIISRFSRDYAQLFIYEGTRHDKHVREHEVYRFRPLADNENLTGKLRDRWRARQEEAAAWAAANPRDGNDAPGKSKMAAARRRKRVVSRFALFATMLGTASIVSAVWSWSSPQDREVATAVASAPAIATEASGTASAQPQPAASKPGDKKSSVKVQEESDKLATSDDGSKAPLKTGKVKLAVRPWGEIYIDGAKRGITPPLKALELSPGKHHIEIRNGEFAAYKQTIEVKSGDEQTVRYTF
jgi:class 3 adenylate cyclase